MSDLYKGHDAEYWHGRYVQSMNMYLETLLSLFKYDPKLKEDILHGLDYSRPGWRDMLSEFVGRRPRPQGVEYLGDDD